MSSQHQRRIAVRRGSVSAPDPFGKHAGINHDPHRSLSSRLTIVRVLDPASSGFTPPPDPPSSPGLHHRRSSRRQGGSSSFSGDNRLSFALSSFAPTSPTQPHSPNPNTQNPSARNGSSPSSSPRIRPSSPSQFTRRLSGSGSAYLRPNLSPEQLVELARQSSNPRFVPQTAPTSPVSPTLSGVSLTTFTPLPPDIYLPFIDRPEEVSTLLSTPPTAKLFSLLAQTFLKGTSEGQHCFTDNPSSWSFQTLRLWLTTVDRETVDDLIWVRNARKCVLTHSELIWERLKGALGVPPELELEDDGELPSDVVLADDANSDAVTESTEQMTAIPGSCPVSPRARSPLGDITIEPIIATPSSNPPPPSLTASLSQSSSMSQGDGLQDIGEEAEEEEIVDNNAQDSKPQEAETQIHGLSISTCPTSSSLPHTPYGFSHSHPSSPDVYLPVAEGNDVESLTSELPASFTRRRSRANSRSSVSSFITPTMGTHRDGRHHPSSSDFGDESEQEYDPVGDRVPGNPLFPSNFARLASGPTLRANNPSLRSPRGAAVARFAHWTPGGRPPSWIDGWDPVKHEYAATVASGSSVGVGGGE
ncbi:hypothetical protein V8B97DRAFT_2015186 [Scleroderma yunnanense]